MARLGTAAHHRVMGRAAANRRCERRACTSSTWRGCCTPCTCPSPPRSSAVRASLRLGCLGVVRWRDVRAVCGVLPGSFAQALPRTGSTCTSCLCLRTRADWPPTTTLSHSASCSLRSPTEAPPMHCKPARALPGSSGLACSCRAVEGLQLVSTQGAEGSRRRSAERLPTQRKNTPRAS